jgi:hypothetical protein
MIVYTVHEPEPHAQSLEERADDIVFVKEGFTWWGFLLGPLWLLFNRLWFEFIAALLLSGAAAAVLVAAGMRDEAPGLANLLIMLIVGFEGNDLKRWRLDRKGYAFLASVAGRDFEECERRFFDAWLPYAAGRSGRIAGSGTATSNTSFSTRGGEWKAPGAIGTLPGATA